jgi:hypothetical protein
MRIARIIDAEVLIFNKKIRNAMEKQKRLEMQWKNKRNNYFFCI